jgi:predicted heme/steroid binding protein
MNDRTIFTNMIQDTLNEISGIIDCLYITPNSCVRNQLLNRLRKHVSNLSMLVQGLHSGESVGNPQPIPERAFTEAELSRYNGRNGNPAYVAVNGLVYDVTNNAAWGGATHFGITAGTDATQQFATCHAGQSILGKLKVVGKMSE